MRLNIKILLVALFTNAFTSGFSQEYDFVIPEEEEAKIEFNGNLDAKLGILQTRKSSPFFGLQFYDVPEKKDYLSQNRLDFYLNGEYRYKKVGFFMKTFTQYAKEEPLSPSFFELYGSLNLSSRLSMSIGKRRFNWGKGYAFNPVGYVNAEKDPENPDLALAGKTSVYINYNKSLASGSLQNFSVAAILLPPEAEINQKFTSADKIGAAFKLYFLLQNIDIDFMAAFRKNEPQQFGMDFSSNLRETWKFIPRLVMRMEKTNTLLLMIWFPDKKLTVFPFCWGCVTLISSIQHLLLNITITTAVCQKMSLFHT